ncbi:MAG: ABC transporter ATP-binding protein [Oscillospiraceae bacterium]|nr:ABC transporter ATP-binding protein [Oscillospiraceae bacterium]
MKMLGRTLKKLFAYYPVLAPVTFACILFSAIVSSIPSLFVQNVIQVIEKWYVSRDWAAARPELISVLTLLVVLYILSILAILVYKQLMAYMTQGFLDKLRQEMFGGMQDLPIRYFDTHQHGDIMSFYTNDIDTLRQLVSEAIPAFIQSGAIVLVVFSIMLYFSLWLTLILICGIVLMVLVTKHIGGGSAKFFLRQQKAVAKTEGYIQETMTGQKVVKVFCHEQRSIEAFDEINNALFEDSFRAHAYASVLGPIIGNIGNFLYVALALVGGVFLLIGLPNVSLSGKALDISILVPFLNMTKQFTGNVNQLSQQINSIVMAGAGAQRVFSLIDETPEADNGYVTLVDAAVAPDGTITESPVHTGRWAWKHPHSDGTITYTELRGDVRLTDVDFAYEEGKEVLHDVSVYAEPGQKVAFVGATGAGKTTITNLINRFYDIADGKIRYDGININKIKKADLRRSLGIVLQDVNLFTGTVMDNIRYGKLDATDEECIAAAKLAGADDFITRLPQGYATELTNNGANLSQGQRQLISIARAAVADPPVMILDEATSSIDTRTEAIVQRGMDKLMEGRTVFVIAHRLSTVKNADVIMVLDHGRIIERGSHEKLIAEKGTYYQLYTGAFELE